MARQKKWVIPFVSLNEISCHIDIYEEGWTGAVTAIAAGSNGTPGYASANAFTYEEDKSDDLLNDVVRFRTGYINLIEKKSGSLQGLYPTNPRQHYVEFYYGNRLDFTGYMQVQDFSNEWVACPRELSFAVTSPLGLLDQFNFSKIYPPESLTIGSLIDSALTALNAAYTRVVLPNINHADLGQTLFSLIVSPWNKDYHHSVTSSSPDVFMAAEPFTTLFEGICKAFGWILHDTPNALVFTMFEYDDTYYYYPVGHVGDTDYYQATPGSSVSPLTNLFTLCDNQAQQSLIQPVSAIEINYGGDSLENMPISFQRTAFHSVTGYGPTEKTSVCNLWPITNEIQGAIGEVQFDANNRVSNYGAFTVALGSKEGILVHLDPATPSGTTLFTIRHYVKTIGKDWNMSFTKMTGDFIADLQTDENIVITASAVEHTNYIEAAFVLTYSTFPDKELLFITDMELKLVTNSQLYSDYQFMPPKNSDTISQVSNMPRQASLDMPFSPFRLSTHILGSSVLTTKFTTYPYLFKPRTELVCKFRSSGLPDIYHTRLYTFWLQDWRWRIISLSFEPWNDLYTLVLQNSEILNADPLDPDDPVPDPTPDPDPTPTPSEDDPELFTEIWGVMRYIIDQSMAGTIPSDGDTHDYLLEMYNDAEGLSPQLYDNNLFQKVLAESGSLITNTTQAKRALHGWLMAMTLAEICPSIQDQLYRAGYNMTSYMNVFGYSMQADPQIARMVASVIYAMNRMECSSLEAAARTEIATADTGNALGTTRGSSIPTHTEETIAAVPDGTKFMPSTPQNSMSNPDYDFDEETWDYIYANFKYQNGYYNNNRAEQAVDDNYATTVDTYCALFTAQGVIISQNQKNLITPAYKWGSRITNPMKDGYDSVTDTWLPGYDQTPRTDSEFRLRPFKLHNKALLDPAGDTGNIGNSSSYPSGHASFGWNNALMLIEAHRNSLTDVKKIMARAFQFGQSRVIGRYHWQADVIHGYVIGSTCLPRLHTYTEYLTLLNNA